MQMDVLNARVSKIDLGAKKNPDLHVNPLFIESVPQGVIPKIKVRQTADDSRTGENGANDVILPQRGVGSIQPANCIRDWLTIHVVVVKGSW